MFHFGLLQQQPSTLWQFVTPRRLFQLFMLLPGVANLARAWLTLCCCSADWTNQSIMDHSAYPHVQVPGAWPTTAETNDICIISVPEQYRVHRYRPAVRQQGAVIASPPSHAVHDCAASSHGPSSYYSLFLPTLPSTTYVLSPSNPFTFRGITMEPDTLNCIGRFRSGESITINIDSTISTKSSAIFLINVFIIRPNCNILIILIVLIFLVISIRNYRIPVLAYYSQYSIVVIILC